MSVTLVTTPWSADPDLFPETAPQNITVQLYPGAPTPVLRQLTSVASLSLIAWNFYSQFIDTAEPIRLLTSLPTVPNENQFTLTDANSGQPMPYTIAYSDSNRRITVTPSVASGQPLWSEARVYNIRIRLRANNGPNGILDQTFSFTPRSSLANANISSPITSLIVDTPDIDSSSRALTFRWPPLKDAFSYSLYVRTSNTARLPSYVRLGNVGATPNPQMGINLGNYNFTSTLEPVSGQPFSFGQVLGFLIVPVDSRGIETDATKGATLELKDVVPPRWEMGIAQLDNGTGGTGVRFVMRSTEAMDRTTAPTVTLPAGLTAGTWSVDESQNGVEGTLRTTGSMSGSGNITVQLRDTSGNLSAPLSVPVFANALVPNHGFEAGSNMCTSAAWTAAMNTTCGGCPTQALTSQPAAGLAVAGSKSAFEGVCALSFGDLDAMYCGTQVIEAPMDLTTISNNRNIYFGMRSWSYYSSGSLTLLASLLNNTSTVISNPVFVSASNNQRIWVNSVADVTGVAPIITRLRLTANASSCGTRGGFQVDDLRVFIH